MADIFRNYNMIMIIIIIIITIVVVVVVIIIIIIIILSLSLSLLSLWYNNHRLEITKFKKIWLKYRNHYIFCCMGLQPCVRNEFETLKCCRHYFLILLILVLFWFIVVCMLLFVMVAQNEGNTVYPPKLDTFFCPFHGQYMYLHRIRGNELERSHLCVLNSLLTKVEMWFCIIQFFYVYLCMFLDI